MAFPQQLKCLCRLALPGLLSATLAGCASSGGPTRGPEEGPPAPEKAAVAEAPSAAPSPSESGAPGETKEIPAGKEIPAAKEIPKALKELEDKLQGGAAAARAPKKPDPQTLQKEAEVFVKQWLEALQKGNVAEAEKFAVSSDLLEKAMNPGYREILQGTVLSQNRLLMERLAALLKGKDVRHQWQPGSVTETPARHVFREAVPSLSSGVLQVDASGIAAEIHLEQLVYLDGQWKIFRMSVP